LTGENSSPDRPGLLRLVEAVGPLEYKTRRVYQNPDGTSRLWLARHHRKRLNPSEEEEFREILTRLRSCLWMPQKLNWWIGSIFTIGASLFMLGSLLALIPPLRQWLGLEQHQVNPVFFAGSIPFTIAAYLQLFQAANAGDFTEHGRERPEHVILFGWRPHDIGWQSCVFQFIGTLLFNFNTFDAMIPGLDWFQQDLAIWIPNFVGSILFLVSGYQAFVETIHAFWAWRPRSLAWWITAWNLFGCLGFMISAFLAFTPPAPLAFHAATLAVLFTLLGAFGFFVGSLLMLPEAAAPAEEN